MREITLIFLLLMLIGCGSEDSLSYREDTNHSYIVHKNITVTTFWVGEPSSDENGGIANIASVWDDIWMLNYGGVDRPDRRNGYYPADFIPNENPFYVALPYNDFDEHGVKKENITSYIPWAKADDNRSLSICKNRWVKIIKGDKVAYAQWEDAGPFGEDDKEYVFGTSLPKNRYNQGAGIDVSPAVRDYLGLEDIDTVDWQFVDEKDVPDGPWKEIVTTHNVLWVDWYKPDINTSWQWQLQGEVNRSYDVKLYDIDLFDATPTLIQSLKADGKKVICYFSAGSYEDWREDSRDFPIEVLGNDLDGWAGEKWLDIRSEDVQSIMVKRLDLAKEKGCDGVEPDNVDGYLNDTGFPLTAQDQLAYNKFIAKEARKRGLSVGLKNDLEQVKELEPFFDFSLNEECHEFDTCDKLQPFIDVNKPVLNAEYAQKYIENRDGARDQLCLEAKQQHLRTLILPIALDDSFRYSCNE